MNGTALTAQVTSVSKRKNLLLWYTADEPDGPSDPVSAVVESRALIEELDGGGLHPVSLSLNCADHHFDAYAAGGNVILADPYPIGINPTYSIRKGQSQSYDRGSMLEI